MVQIFLDSAVKVCSRCKSAKSRSCFSPQKTRKDGLFAYCRECTREYRRRWQQENPDRVRKSKEKYRSTGKWKESWLKYRYGLSLEEYERLLRIQGGCCAICGSGQLNRRLVVDHCHESNIVRGLLCGPCNSMLGMARDNPEILLGGFKYLNQFKLVTSNEPGCLPA